VAGTSVTDIAGVAAEFGLECQSFEQHPEMGGTWAMDCRLDDGNVTSSIVVSYWAPDYIDGVTSVVMSSGNGVAPAGSAGPMFELLAERLLGNAAASRVAEYVDNPACRDTCSMTVGATKMVVTVGVHGARQIAFSPADD
jgi:hypothetical protein